MATAAELEKKIASLENFQEIVGKFVAALGDPSKFEFRGDVIDLGVYGAGKCTCGHPVRYMLLIWGPDGKVAPCGCECVKHFQSYNETLFNKLENARLGLYEALAAEERERVEVIRQSEISDILPTFEFAKERFLMVCQLHKERIRFMIPRALWLLQANLQKKPVYKTTLGLLNFYKRMVITIEETLGKYERGELL